MVINTINDSNNQGFRSLCGFVRLFLYFQEVNTSLPHFEDEETEMLSSPPQITPVCGGAGAEVTATISLNKAVSATLLGALVCSVCQRRLMRQGC